VSAQLKVLISAYACEPDKGSEPGVGWNFVKQVSRFHKVWVITRESNRLAIEEALKKESVNDVSWIYFDLPYWARFWKKGERGVHLYYYIWQASIYFLAEGLHKTVDFDIIHHVTFVNYWMPSFLVFLPVPFIWGPVGGGDSTLRNFCTTFSLKGKIYEFLRNTAQWSGEKTPFVIMNARKAVLTLATTEETATRVSRMGAKNVMIYSQCGITKEEFSLLSKFPVRKIGPFRLISIGRLLHFKGLHLALLAFSRIIQSFPDSRYWIIGNGPEKNNLKKLVCKLGLQDKVYFWGNLPRDETLKKLSECDVLVHPSLHESGGFVCLEAMASGRAVVCFALGGPSINVTSQCGFKIFAGTPDQAINELTESLLKLAENIDLRINMGQEGIRRIAEYFIWDKKGELLNDIYHNALR